jgi:hypothetical protein
VTAVSVHERQGQQQRLELLLEQLGREGWSEWGGELKGATVAFERLK